MISSLVIGGFFNILVEDSQFSGAVLCAGKQGVVLICRYRSPSEINLSAIQAPTELTWMLFSKT